MIGDKIQYLIANDKVDELLADLKARIPETVRAGYYRLPYEGQTLLVGAHEVQALQAELDHHWLATNFCVPADEDSMEADEWDRRFNGYDHFRSQCSMLNPHELHPPTEKPSVSLSTSSVSVSIDRRFNVSRAPLVDSSPYGPFDPVEANVWVTSTSGARSGMEYRSHVWPARDAKPLRSRDFMGKLDSDGQLTGNPPAWLGQIIRQMFTELETLNTSLDTEISEEQVEAAAEAMWDAARPVRAGVRPRWASIVGNPEYKAPVMDTLREARVAVAAAHKQRRGE